MANLTVRKLDQETVDALKRQAKAHNRSLESEVRHILSTAVQPSVPVDLRALADRVAALTPDVPQTDSAELLREDRQR